MKWKLAIFSFLGLFFLSFYYVSNYKNNFIVSYDINIIENDGRWVGELYYSDGSSYTSKYAKQVRYKKNKDTFQNITITIDNLRNLHNIRFDPLLNSSIIEIKNFTVTYLNEIYRINFSTIHNHHKNNIIILKHNKSSALIKSIGKDPFIELSNNINFNKVNIKNIERALIYTITLFLVLMFFVQLIKLFSFEKVVLVGVLSLYSVYTLFFLSTTIASNLLILFAFLSLSVTLYNNFSNLLIYTKYIGIFLFFYLLMGYLSLFFTTDLANPAYFYTKIPYIILALLLPIGFYNLKYFNMHFFKIILTILLVSMSCFIIFLDQNILSIQNIQIFDLTTKRSHWTQKNYMFWYVLMMFGTLAFYNIKKRSDLLIILSILTLSYFTVFGGYSLSAKLSFSIGVLVYFILSLFKIQKTHLLIIIWLFTFYIIFSPIIFALIDFTFLPKLVARDAIYKTSFALIKENWLFGYGYGSTLTINLKDFVGDIDLPKHYIKAFPGGHPHNLSLLFWLEFGVVGAAFLAYYIHKLLAFIIINTYNNTSQAAILSMVVSFDIITSFSWSIWYPSVLLTFAFFGIMLTLSMNIKSLKITQ